MEPTKHQGSCHCGDVRYEVVLDASKGTRCNCRICTKLGTTGSIVKPEAFTLLSDEANLATYTRHPEIGCRYFCKRCHVMCFSKGHLAQLGGDFVGINLNTLDDIDPGSLALSYWDGRHDNWQAGVRPTPWPIAAASA
ncbi:MAG TPA: GFA family protein [Kofleriaceae bacterium]|nr:GFA family protein [Kofleriaceae bacterium]